MYMLCLAVCFADFDSKLRKQQEEKGEGVGAHWGQFLT